MLDILEPHQVRIAERCRSRLVVLAVQDTTILNYSGLETAEGIVDIGGYVSGSNGPRPTPRTHKLREGYLILSFMIENSWTMRDDANLGVHSVPLKDAGGSSGKFGKTQKGVFQFGKRRRIHSS